MYLLIVPKLRMVIRMTIEKLDREKKVLLPYEQERIGPILDQIKLKKLQFEHFITINYEKRCDDWTQVVGDNSRLRRFLRKYYKSDIKMISFIEKHTEPDSYFFGSYHRHILLSTPPSVESQKWKHILNKLIRDNVHSVCPSRTGLKIKDIYYLEGLLSYCTKQVGKFQQTVSDVVDTKNTDIDLTDLLRQSRYKEARYQFSYT